MSKTQKNIRMSEFTANQLAEIAQKTGLNDTEVITLAIDRLHRKEIAMNKSKTLYERAYDRVENMGFSSKEMSFIFADWPEGDEHYQWLLKASKKEIQSWVNAGSK